MTVMAGSPRTKTPFGLKNTASGITKTHSSIRDVSSLFPHAENAYIRQQ